MAIYCVQQAKTAPAARKAYKRFESTRNEEGLNAIQQEIVRVVREYGDGLSVADISELTGLRKDTISPRMLDLQAMGYVLKTEVGKGIFVWYPVAR